MTHEGASIILHKAAFPPSLMTILPTQEQSVPYNSKLGKHSLLMQSGFDVNKYSSG